MSPRRGAASPALRARPRGVVVDTVDGRARRERGGSTCWRRRPGRTARLSARENLPALAGLALGRLSSALHGRHEADRSRRARPLRHRAVRSARDGDGQGGLKHPARACRPRALEVYREQRLTEVAASRSALGWPVVVKPECRSSSASRVRPAGLPAGLVAARAIILVLARASPGAVHGRVSASARSALARSCRATDLRLRVQVHAGMMNEIFPPRFPSSPTGCARWPPPPRARLRDVTGRFRRRRRPRACSRRTRSRHDLAEPLPQSAAVAVFDSARSAEICRLALSR
jgi:hypothetical protein